MPTITPLALPEVLIITPQRYGDGRGWFSEVFNRDALAAAGVDSDFMQDNQAFSARKGTVRGFHFQRGAAAQAKLVRVLKGAIYDVALDLRAGSASYGRWVGAILTAEGGEQILVPRGFGHAYCTLTDDCELIYKVDNAYAPKAEGGVLWCDPALRIDWPVSPDEVVLSDKDRLWPSLADMPPAGF